MGECRMGVGGLGQRGLELDDVHESRRLGDVRARHLQRVDIRAVDETRYEHRTEVAAAGRHLRSRCQEERALSR
jgi:hypothetical protein